MFSFTQPKSVSIRRNISKNNGIIRSSSNVVDSVMSYRRFNTPEFTEIKTRKDVFENMRRFLYVQNGEEVFDTIMTLNQKGADPSTQGYLFESLFEILILAKCIQGVSYTKMFQGKFSSLIPITHAKQVLEKSYRQGGNLSDITIETENEDKKTVISFSVKYKKDSISADFADISEIDTQLKRDILTPSNVGLIVKDKTQIKNAHDKGRNSNRILEDIKTNQLLFDTTDCIRGMNMFKDRYLTTLVDTDSIMDRITKDCLNMSRKRLVKKLHQEMTLQNFIDRISKDVRMVCIAHKPRSGKSITILLICKYLIETGKANRILIMTSVPSTLASFEKDLDDYIEFKDIRFKRQSEINNIDPNFCGIVFCSVQYLKIGGKRTNKKELLINLKFDAMGMDECHIGGSTEKTRDNIMNADDESANNTVKNNCVGNR